MCTIGRGDSSILSGPTGRGVSRGLVLQPREKTLTILKGDIIGHARLACQGAINPEWICTMESPNLINSVGKHKPAVVQHNPKLSRTQQPLECQGSVLPTHHPDYG